MMNDLISREEVKKAINNYFKSLIGKHIYEIDVVDCNAELCNDVIDKIDIAFDIDNVADQLDETTTKMMEHVCDKLCRHPLKASEEELESICAECQMDKFVCQILNSVVPTEKTVFELITESPEALAEWIFTNVIKQPWMGTEKLKEMLNSPVVR